jgi:hypothetical protein
VRSIVARYYWAIRIVLRQRPELKRCLARCRHCQILFFTHPRNAGRSDLGCPFGCRQARRRQRSTERSVAYYRSKEGKKKKIALNQRRNRTEHIPASASDGAAGVEIEAERAIFSHIQLVVGLIEGYRVVLESIKRLVVKLLRQHRIDLGKDLLYPCRVPP